jgi:undecaprenyl-diphosphatase
MDIDILLSLQQFRNGAGGFLTDFLNKMTFLGELNTAIVLMAIIYWCVSKDIGSYLLMGWSGNRLVNGVLKVTVCAYRPWIRDPRIVPYGNSMTTATGYSFPSGHTMNAATTFGGFTVRRDMPTALRVVTGLMVLLVGFSRPFLGVHTPQDVLVGAAAGMLVMWLVWRMMQWLETHPEKDRLVVLVGLLLAAAVAVYAAVKPYPEDYNAEGKLIVDGAKMANDTFKGVGWCAAFLVGWILERRYVGFSTDISVPEKLTRAAVGAVSYYAVSLIVVPAVKGWIPGPAGTMCSCFLQMFYVSFLFPWCMKYLYRAKRANTGTA